MHITSADNPVLRSIRKASRAGRPTDEGLVVAEGPHLLQEALRGNWRVDSIYTTFEGETRYAGLLQDTSIKAFQLSARAFSSVAGTETSQGIFALLQPREYAWPELVGNQGFLVVADGIQDPGNLGTIVRSAEAFAATGLVLAGSSVRVANGKFLRATAGSIFRMPYRADIAPRELLAATRESGITPYALVPQGGKDIREVDFNRPCAVIVGNEGAGVSAELLDASERISIGTSRVESLNAAVACSIALFEASKRRRA